jgi:hypothetical protein
LSLFAVAGKAGRGTLRDRLGARRGSDERERYGGDYSTHREILAFFVIARSETTKQSSFCMALDCFASLAMTNLDSCSVVCVAYFAATFGLP